jgi:hypothetical protein
MDGGGGGRRGRSGEWGIGDGDEEKRGVRDLETGAKGLKD